jgi:hypothetical protein
MFEFSLPCVDHAILSCGAHAGGFSRYVADTAVVDEAGVTTAPSGRGLRGPARFPPRFLPAGCSILRSVRRHEAVSDERGHIA